MKIRIPALVALIGCALPSMAAAETETGYYTTLRVIDAHHQARNMDASARPGIGQFVAGDQRQHFATGSLAFGQIHGNGWRSEAEYVARRNDTYTSGSSIFASSFNNHEVRSQRLMLNVYRDIALNATWSLYGTAGAGLSHIQSGGWQGNEGRQYAKATRTGLAWSLGAGISVAASDALSVDLGYRYADLGSTESGWNTFSNARGLQDERMKLDLVSREVTLGLRYVF
ncbi:porin family protein [Stenotrophomonas maltophilia]|uniref:outer membrane protein n=1 Tax=Stenotrophomonas maltophilia TaxID=40324 RepID=UPI0015DE40C5|nr:outer membrane beta-barrel protein [Stenotrophomonas maltophilia]MBA0387057.1 porin family protein [Stenotrophomonas maltophilia]MBA0390155.1 porin family protein [Stenotrophomonas maltophilia]MBA0463684.1 porin family protein [Stenotrophomonas maltophilia]MBA0471198.1 porin family protein [Stenotrophomonas maltophilia]